MGSIDYGGHGRMQKQQHEAGCHQWGQSLFSEVVLSCWTMSYLRTRVTGVSVGHRSRLLFHLTQGSFYLYFQYLFSFLTLYFFLQGLFIYTLDFLIYIKYLLLSKSFESSSFLLDLIFSSFASCISLKEIFSLSMMFNHFYVLSGLVSIFFYICFFPEFSHSFLRFLNTDLYYTFIVLSSFA